MFNFMKKSTVVDTGGCEERDGEKERRKKEKKERKEREKRERIAAGLEEPLRLEEVRRSLKLRGRRKEKEKLPSGITADYTASLFAHLEQDSNYSNYPLIPTSGSNSNLSDENNHLSPGYPTPAWSKREGVLQSDSSETSLNSLNNPNNANTSPRQPPNLPPVPPRPPKRGILKGPRLSNTSNNSQESNVQSTDTTDFVNGQDPNVLARNTQQNEVICYGIPPSKSTSSSDDAQHVQNFTKKVIHSPVENQYKNYKNNANPTITTQDVDEAPKTNGNSYVGVTSTSPSADSLTDTTTNSSFATPPFSTSPVGESQGFHRWSRISNFEDVYLPLPALTPLQLPKPRVLTIQRQKAPRNDFGFSLRRAVIQERVFIGDLKELNGHEENGLTNGDSKFNGNLTSRVTSKLTYKAVILAEPGSYPGSSETGLLPGDRLLEVNGVSVEGKNREEVIDLIKSSQEYVTVKVQPIAELCELSRRRAADGGGDVELADSNVRGGTLSRSGSRRFHSTQAKTEEQLACEKEWLKAGHMWLAHRGGFTAVVREGDADAGRARVRVLQTGETLTVDEDDLEKGNPPQLERCEDIATLRCLNECGALHVLRSRHAAGLPHARAGHALLVTGPPRHAAPAYTDKVAAMFRGCRSDDMPPHVFAAAQSAHRCMLASRRDRAIVFLGRSGSGKTSAMRHCVWYLASAYPAQGSKLTPERLDAAFDVLYAFGTSRTSTNPHASRFVSLASLDFDGGGALVSASVQTLLPDLRPTQSALRAIHTLVHGCDGRLRRELLLDQSPVGPNPVLGGGDVSDAPASFSALKEALKLLNVTEQEQLNIWRILAAIAHLGPAPVCKANAGSGMKYQFSSSGAASRAARLLGVSAEELARAIFSATPSSPQPGSNLRTPSPSNEREVSGSEALDAFISGLYGETFNIVAALVNRSLSTSARTSASILLLDTPGADNPMCAGQQSGAPLSKLLSNYLQERLQAVFHEAMLVSPRERYAQEGIALEDGAEEEWQCEAAAPAPLVDLLDRAPQHSIVRSSQTDLRDCDRRGLLWLLDEESMYPGSSDDTFVERVLQHYAAPNHTQHLIKKAPHARQFVLQHLQGTNPVLYDVTGWVKASRENPVTKKALAVLQESQNEEIARLSSWARGACGVGAWSVTVGDASTLRRASSIRRTLTSGTAGMKRRSTALQAKFVADGIVDTLRRCGSGGVQFVCCLLTNHPSEPADDVNVPLLRSQFRGFQLLEAARLYKQGFPEHMPLSEFARRYRLLATSESESEEPPQPLSDRQVVDDMLLALDLDVSSYRLGLTQRRRGAGCGWDEGARHKHAARRCARAPPHRAGPPPAAGHACDMPAVKVFNIFGGQKSSEKHPPPANAPHGPMQKFYRTFSVGPETSPEHKGSKVTAIAACLEKRISEPVKLNSDSVQKLLTKLHVSDTLVNGKSCGDKRHHVYENVNISGVDRNARVHKLLDETKGYSSIYENIPVVGKSTLTKVDNSVNNDSKLNKALESFDKILSEFSSNTLLTSNVNITKTSFVPPKLQKSKTCSIIESRCILKKANSDLQSDSYTRNKVARNNSIDKTTSLWNLDDMKGKELTAPLMPLTSTPNDKMNPDKYATYKISSKNSSRVNCIKTEDLKKLDVKTRILKKTLSNPPSTPVPVVAKTKPVAKKVEKKVSDPKKTKLRTSADNSSSNTKTSLESKETPKTKMQKAKSVWEIGNESMISPNLERTRSSTSIAGSPSKIPVIRSQMSNTKFSSTRALFSPTPVDLSNVEQARECAQKKKINAPRKNAEKLDTNKQIRQKSQLNLKSDQKRQSDKVKKESYDKKTPSPKSSMRDYSDEINAVRAKLQQKKNNLKRDLVIAAEPKRVANESEEIDSTLSPVKSIVKKLELKTALETKAEPAQFVNCKVLPPVHKEVCVANTTFHNHLSTLVGRQVKYVESRDDVKTCRDEKLVHKQTEEKISDTHSDCSDDSGHVSNDAANDHDSTFDNVHDLSPAIASVDEVDCKACGGPKEFGIDVPDDAKSVFPVRPARRARRNEVASGTRATDAPKVDEQIMFRGGLVGGLDARRDAALARVLVRLQARARGLLTRRRALRLRTQHTAARCIQRNVRAFLAVRDWPWWRLLVRVTPLLAVHRTEHRLKQAQDELETLRSKLDKVENERTHFKNETEKLETKLSEVGGELTEERAAAAIASERADAEAAERLRVERDNRDLLTNNQRLQQASERLELELLHWRSAENGGAEPSDSEGSEADTGGGSDKYKRRYEQAHRELQLLRAQLRRQHEDDLEQLVSVKKQLEKKVQDAYEEAEEQRAVSAQWKRKLQKLTNDMADLRSLLDEQTCRNNLLEKRQRKFDGELQALQEELKRERAAKERLSRDRDQAQADKYALEQSLSEARLELELKEERLAASIRELEERGGGGDEVTSLRRAKAELERRVRDQEEELDDLAGQIQLLESSKLRVEMLLEQQRKEARLEAAARDDEMEETRANAAKKLKMLESQLESEHSERSLLLRERHELERRLAALEETARAETHEQAQLVQRLKRDLKRYRALLRDAQTMLEQKEKEGGGKAQIRQLKNQVEDLELAVRAATKAKQAAEAEAAEATAALEEATRTRNDASERALIATRDAAAARAQLDDAEEEAAELLKKYRASTSALCAAQAEAREAGGRADAAAEEARAARDRLAELSARLAHAEAGHSHGRAEAERRLDLRNKELESSLELEATARGRLEGQVARLRDAHDALAAERAAARQREHQAADELRKLQRQLRELKEENSALSGKLSESARARAAAEAAAAGAAAEAAAARDEARLAARRAAALQEAIAGDLSTPPDSRDTDSDDSYSSDESIGTFLAHHQLSPSAPAPAPAPAAPSRASHASSHLDSQKSQSPEGRSSRLSAGSGKQLSPTKESFA